MDFAKIATKNNNNHNSLQLPVIFLLVGYFALVSAFYWFAIGYQPKVEGRLNQVKVIKSYGQYKLNGAKGIATDENGLVYAVDSRNDRVVVYSSQGRVKRTIGGREEDAQPRLKNPTAVTVAKDKIFVSSYGNGQILVYDKEGALLDTLPHNEDKNNLQSLHALALTSGSEGNIYAADGKQHRIIVFDHTGKLKLIFGETGSLEGQFKYINGLAIAEDKGQLMVLDAGNQRIQIFTLEGKYLQQIFAEENGRNLLIAPRGMAYNPKNGLVYITEPLLDQVFAVNVTGQVVFRTKQLDMSYPHGIAISSKDLVYVTNRETGKITVLNP